MNRNRITYRKQLDGQWVTLTGVVLDTCLVAQSGGPVSAYLVKLGPGSMAVVTPGQITDVEEYQGQGRWGDPEPLG